MSLKKVWYAPNRFESYGEEEIKAVEECLRSGWLAGFGPRSIEFEEKVAAFFGKKYGVFVNSGSSACLLALASLQLPKGTKVITPACTFSTTLAPIIQLGLEPVFVDVGLDDYVAQVEEVLAAVTDDVKVLMIPNLIGNKPNWKALKDGLAAMGREESFAMFACSSETGDEWVTTQKSCQIDLITVLMAFLTIISFCMEY